MIAEDTWLDEAHEGEAPPRLARANPGVNRPPEPPHPLVEVSTPDRDEAPRGLADHVRTVVAVTLYVVVAGLGLRAMAWLAGM